MNPIVVERRSEAPVDRVREALFVDDEPEICRFYERLLRHARHLPLRATIASDARQALALAHARPFDLVVSDFRMPGADGAAILTAARERNPGGRRVLVTGYNEIPAPLPRLREAGVEAYLQKPFDPVELFLIVVDFLEGRGRTIRTLAREAGELEAASPDPRSVGVRFGAAPRPHLDTP
ncbi:MAG TPA: response regulator [Candidatus Thermoplasmatota archaeon]|nr:response regulator [Candidatus Thermoplasmatota archaeon]